MTVPSFIISWWMLIKVSKEPPTVFACILNFFYKKTTALKFKLDTKIQRGVKSGNRLDMKLGFNSLQCFVVNCLIAAAALSG